jgi:hypothetical protein
MSELSLDAQWPFIVLAGAGMGLVVAPANTDAINRAPRASYGEATGITQTVRNFGASLGLAVLGTILILQNKSNIEDSLGGFGISKEKADDIAASLTQGGGGDATKMIEHAGANAGELFQAVQLDFALATRTVFYVMAGALAVAFVVAVIGMPRGKVEDKLAVQEGDAASTPN